ncbi:hypothetical protein [Photobacterium halotolerans]|uniref:Uncharacterized protein n=1 Tax=Photobacterium halotolerans TaxID=265726 RepID=A0A7X4WSX5_9GAMM|nr:hypothetical protein [Photobacterium halotolerans]NAW66311.1 hypothetical protein [Photobacterium halotolerans]NAW88255.1 hypothetical protein [Photobacterium halotolerans]NAX46478.1 hypothetical protein [Photobacterium halotolerans]
MTQRMLITAAGAIWAAPQAGVWCLAGRQADSADPHIVFQDSAQHWFLAMNAGYNSVFAAVVA